jgi:hypothetical protein
MSIPKVTEDTVTQFIAEELRKRGIKVETFPSIRTPKGIRKPDIWCSNGGVYVIEAKTRERDLIEAVAKIYEDYIKFHEVLGIRGGFAILYPEQLTKPLHLDALKQELHGYKFKVVAIFPPKDVRKSFVIVEGYLNEIVKFLAEHILAPPEYIEPRIEYIIDTLRRASEYLTSVLSHLTFNDVEKFFGGKDVFKNILQYKEGRMPIDSLRLASAYLLITQLLFYHILSKKNPDKFPEIDADVITRPSDLQKYFNKVLETNYRSIFSYDVASLIPQNGVNAIKNIINAIKAISPEKVGGDLLGTIFHDLIPQDVRKVVAAYYTNVLAAELLAWLAIDHYSWKVADFACGSGGLLVAAYRRKKYLLEKEKGVFTEEDHRRFVEDELLGVDVMPFAASIAACNLALQAPEYLTNKVNIAIWDSTELAPGKIIPSIAGLGYVLKGQMTLDTYLNRGVKEPAKGVVSLTDKAPENIKLELYDVIIMNPPFTRQEKIPQEYKKLLLSRFEEYKSYIRERMGYFGYFILLADRFLKDGGRMALVLPVTVLHRDSAEGIRRLWAEKYELEYVITTWQRYAFSESTYFRDMLLIAKKKRPSDNAIVKICILKKMPDTFTKARQLAEKLRNILGDYEDDEVIVKTYPYSNFRSDTADWYKYISVSDFNLIDWLENELLASDKLVALSQIVSTKSDIIRSDLDKFKVGRFHGFILRSVDRIGKNDYWYVDSQEKDVFIVKHVKLNVNVKVPRECLANALRRHSHVDTLDVTNNSDYLIVKWFDGFSTMASYTLSSNELKKLGKDTIDKWYSNYRKRESHLLLARRPYMASPGTHLIAFYSEVPIIGIDMWSIKGISEEYAKMLTLWLNSSLNILQLLYLGVACEGAWMKIHEYMFERMKVPDLDKLSPDEKNELLKLFESLRSYKFKSLYEQFREGDEMRKAIDMAWLRILTMKKFKEEYEALLKRIYEAVTRELEILRQQEQEEEEEEEG